MSWFIAGATGQLGIAMERALTKRGLTVTSVGSNDLDITQPEMIHSYFERFRPRVVINAAAWTDVDSAELNYDAAALVNATGARNLAIASKNIGSSFVQISTDYVFSGKNLVPWKTTDEHAPLSNYGLSKSIGEKSVLEVFPEKSYIVRTAWLYSDVRKNFAKTMTRLALFGDTQVQVVYDQIGQPTFAGDLAHQIIDLVTNDSPFGCYHGTNSGQASWFEFSQKIFRLLGADVSRITPVLSSEFSRPANRPAYSVLSHDDWKTANLEPMRDWRLALAEAIPSIKSAVMEEGN